MVNLNPELTSYQVGIVPGIFSASISMVDVHSV
jgi:hypothetical protein